jgi:hypothetical protein
LKQAVLHALNLTRVAPYLGKQYPPDPKATKTFSLDREDTQWKIP